MATWGRTSAFEGIAAVVGGWKLPVVGSCELVVRCVAHGADGRRAAHPANRGWCPPFAAGESWAAHTIDSEFASVQNYLPRSGSILHELTVTMTAQRVFTLRFQLGLSLRFFLLQGGNLRPVGGLTVHLYLCHAPLSSRALRCTASVTPPLLSLTVCCNYWSP